MHPIVDSRRAELSSLCRRYGVRRLDVFGSAADGSFDPSCSDIDVLVEFAHTGAFDPLDQYFGLKAGLEAMFGRQVDVLVEGAARNPYLLDSIERSRQPVYEA